MRIIPIWGQAVIALVVVTIIFGSGYKVATWKWSGRVEKAVAAQEKAEKEAREKVALEAQWRADVQAIRDQMEIDAAEQAELQAAYEVAVSKPPRVVVEYRDRWHDVPTTIVSHDCVEGVGELFTFINSLPVRPQ